MRKAVVMVAVCCASLSCAGNRLQNGGSGCGGASSLLPLSSSFSFAHFSRLSTSTMPVALLPLLFGATLVAAQQTERKITFKNSCPKDVWIVGTSGATGNCADGCQTGSSCNTANNLCFFDVPGPSLGNHRVPVGQENTFTFPAWENESGIAWSGNFNACMQGTLCGANGKVADEGTCDSQGCASFHVGTMIEITMAKKNVDFYDVSNIGGIAVPMSFEPEVPNARAEDPYWCANLGGVTPKTGLGPNPWQFQVPDPKYNWVVANKDAPSCGSDADCNGSTCGLSLDQDDQVTFRLQCGQLAGYWTQNAICAANPNTDVMPCHDTFQNGQFNADIYRFQGCTGDVVSGSCYSQGAVGQCCGCADWQDVFGEATVPALTKRCESTNPLWTEKIQPTLEWLKKGAPNVYTYPYDDVSSTSTCDNMNGEWNTQNYIVELCPGGVYWGTTPSPAPAPADPTPEPAPSSDPVPEPAPTSDPAPPVDPAPVPSPSPNQCSNPSKRSARKAKRAVANKKKRAEALAHHQAQRHVGQHI
ncbi:hypothetical protein BKA62DRAFT_722211 [Auriculariales sp. MPI-PUGE-AT-0066]|nr:hypothetical protein BKA62DRAFT_722211 [Auriculariales sp. MPI-PUGE-AT-0066]